MGETQHFSIRKVSALVRRARKAAELPEETGERDGWFKSLVDPMKLVAVFQPLRVKHGLILRAYQFREGGNGNSFVYAMPVDAPFPDPEACTIRRDDEFLEPPVPDGSLTNYMEAIEGDDSHWSYLASSLLARELAEFGAMWHGCSWSTHTILGSDPFASSGAGKKKEQRSAAFESHFDSKEWKWLKPVPKEWRPTVCMSNSEVEVDFLTHSALGGEGIFRHLDRYKPSTHCFKAEQTTMADGPGGFVF